MQSSKRIGTLLTCVLGLYWFKKRMNMVFPSNGIFSYSDKIFFEMIVHVQKCIQMNIRFTGTRKKYAVNLR